MPWELEKECEAEKSLLKLLRLKIERLIESRDQSRNFLAVVAAAKTLTGDIHEGHPVCYTLIFAYPEALRLVERVLSHETRRDERDPHLGKHGNTFSAEEIGAALARRCSGHHAIFQERNIAGFIDAIEPHLGLSDLVLLEDPTSRQLANKSLPDDDLRSLRWLTAERPAECIAFQCGRDGVLRVVIDGHVVLIWDPQKRPGLPPWSSGIELLGIEDRATEEERKSIAKQQESLLAVLRRCIRESTGPD